MVEVELKVELEVELKVELEVELQVERKSSGSRAESEPEILRIHELCACCVPDLWSDLIPVDLHA